MEGRGWPFDLCHPFNGDFSELVKETLADNETAESYGLPNDFIHTCVANGGRERPKTSFDAFLEVF